jgi:hypothetical protein
VRVVPLLVVVAAAKPSTHDRPSVSWIVALVLVFVALAVTVKPLPAHHWISSATACWVVAAELFAWFVFAPGWFYWVKIPLGVGVAALCVVLYKKRPGRVSADTLGQRQRLIRAAKDLADHLHFILDDHNLQPFDPKERTDPDVEERFRITLWHFTKYLAAATPIREGSDKANQKLQDLVHEVGNALSHERKDLGLDLDTNDRRVIYAHQGNICKQGIKRNAVDDLDDFTTAYNASFSKTLGPLIAFLDCLTPGTAAWGRLMNARDGLLVIKDQ